MEWTEPKPPTEGVSYYDHVLCKSPLGGFIIEWKSWKSSPSYDIMLEGEWIGCEYSLPDAKTIAFEYIIKKHEELTQYLDSIK